MPTAGPAIALTAVVAGILAGEWRGPSDAREVLALGAAAAVVAALSRVGRLRLVAVTLACLALGAAGTQRALHGLVASPLRAAVEARADVTVRATLVDDPEGTRWSTHALVRVDAWARGERVPTASAGGRRILVSAGGAAATTVKLLESGEGLTARGWLAPLEGFDEREQWRHAVATLHVTAVTSVVRAHNPLVRVANRARAVVLAGSNALAPIDRGVLTGFLLGDTRGVPPAVESQFRAAGLTHLMAVSGENVAFVLALVAPLVRRLGLRGRFVTSLAVLVLFGTMTRWEPSVARAIVMAGIALLAGYLGRPSVGLRVLLLAASALLLVDPFLIHSVGFLLSCGASLGITLWARPIAARLRGPVWMRDVLGVTAAAQLGVLPVLVPVFGSVPLVALPANLVAVPLAEPLTIWGILAGALNAVLGALSPIVPRLLAIPTEWLLHALLAVADVASRVPVAVDGRGLAAVATVTALAAALHRARSLRRDARPIPAR
ncbi:MAG: ComEC/Rec2 family competence protein [Acidimicrobiia bacterium]